MLLAEDFSPSDDLHDFGLQVRTIIAEELTCAGCTLDPDDDIELEVRFACVRYGDHTPCDIRLTIEAFRFDGRQGRSTNIRRRIKELLPEGAKLGVWLDLKDAEWSGEDDDEADEHEG